MDLEKEIVDNQVSNSEQPRTNESAAAYQKNKRKVLVLIFVLIIAAIIIGVLVFILSSRTKPTSTTLPSEPENVLLAIYEGNQIYREDVVDVALEQYLLSGLNSEILNNSLDIAVERVILETEARRLNIQIDPASSKREYFQNLKDTIRAREIGTVTANTISFWTPAFNDIYPQTAEDNEMRELQPKVFEEAILSLEEGKSTYEVGKEILEKYPVYTQRLAVNSYILSKMGDTSLLQKPITYEYLVNDSNRLLLDFLFATNIGQTRILVWPEGEGAAIVQVVDKNSGDKISYEDWLQTKRESVIVEFENVSKL